MATVAEALAVIPTPDPDGFREALTHHGQHAIPYQDIILAQPLSPCLLWSLGQGESGWGAFLKPPTAAGTGDEGHGRGLMQIDDGAFGPDESGVQRAGHTGNGWLAANDWRDPAINIPKGVAIFMEALQAMSTLNLSPVDTLRAGLAGYNSGAAHVIHNIVLGLDIDHGTISVPPNRYGQNAIDRALAMAGWCG